MSIQLLDQKTEIVFNAEKLSDRIKEIFHFVNNNESLVELFTKNDKRVSENKKQRAKIRDEYRESLLKKLGIKVKDQVIDLALESMSSSYVDLSFTNKDYTLEQFFSIHDVAQDPTQKLTRALENQSLTFALFKDIPFNVTVTFPESIWLPLTGISEDVDNELTKSDMRKMNKFLWDSMKAIYPNKFLVKLHGPKSSEMDMGVLYSNESVTTVATNIPLSNDYTMSYKATK